MWASFTWRLWRARKSNILRLILHTLWYAKKVLCESLSLSLIQTHQITSISLQILAYFTVAHVSWFSTTYMKPEVALNRSHLCKLLLNVISSYHRHFMNVKNVVHFVLPSLSHFHSAFSSFIAFAVASLLCCSYFSQYAFCMKSYTERSYHLEMERPTKNQQRSKFSKIFDCTRKFYNRLKCNHGAWDGSYVSFGK